MITEQFIGDGCKIQDYNESKQYYEMFWTITEYDPGMKKDSYFFFRSFRTWFQLVNLRSRSQTRVR